MKAIIEELCRYYKSLYSGIVDKTNAGFFFSFCNSENGRDGSKKVIRLKGTFFSLNYMIGEYLRNINVACFRLICF